MENKDSKESEAEDDFVIPHRHKSRLWTIEFNFRPRN